MALSAPVTASVVEIWRRKFFKEYIRASRFKRFMGKDENSIIQLVEDLTKTPGDKINIPLVAKLSGAATTGSSTLEGNEEALGNFNHQLTVNMKRHGVVIHKMDQKRTAIDFLDAARGRLKMWEMEEMRTSIINTMTSPVRNAPTTTYADATEAQKDTWVDDNSDRVLFGAVTSNRSAADHSASLANVDSTNDLLTPDAISLMKRLAQAADPIVMPVVIKEDEEWYTLFVPSLLMRDLRANSVMLQANREARERGKDNPLFRAGELIWESVVIREIPEIGIVAGVGASSIDVAPCFFCGAQAVGVGWGQRPQPKMQTTDYGAKKGVAIEEIIGVEKLYYNNKQHGMLTGWFSAVAD